MQETPKSVKPTADGGEASPAAKKPGRTAVVYFHGMGSQRRLEELSRLVDQLDAYGSACRDAWGVGRLLRIEPKLEEPRPPLEEDVAFIRLRHGLGEGDETEYQEVRFYEVYWAPVMAEGVPALQVFKWLLAQMPAPLRALRAPWRFRARLRRAALQRWWCSVRGTPRRRFEDDDLPRLLRLYDDFEGWEARRSYPRGSFKDFLAYIGVREEEAARKRRPFDPEKSRLSAARLVEMARRWRRSYVLSELLNAFALLTILLALAIGFAAALAGVVIALKWLGGSGAASALGRIGFSDLNEYLAPSWKSVSAVLALVLGMSGLTKFMRDYLGDVQAWTTYEETNEKFEKRRAVLKLARETLSHVLEDPECGRVVVVAHSLGTTIAHDALLALGRHNRARTKTDPISGPLPLEKIDTLITFGSPIDKVHYFFESHAGRSHRYNRVFEEVRGDIGEIPFAKNRQPSIHWINFWDQADVISSSLETPCDERMGDLLVDNCRVSSFAFPSPGASHSAYFEHRTVVGVTYDAIFHNKYFYRDAPIRPAPARGRDYESRNVGPGSAGASAARFFQTLFLLMPWLLLATIAAHAAAPLARVKLPSLVATLAVASVLALSWLVSRLYFRHLAPFGPRAAAARPLDAGRPAPPTSRGQTDDKENEMKSELNEGAARAERSDKQPTTPPGGPGTPAQPEPPLPLPPDSPQPTAPVREPEPAPEQPAGDPAPAEPTRLARS